MTALSVELAGYTWPELIILSHHLEYAAGRLRQELAEFRQAQRRRPFYPGQQKSGPRVLISHWAGLIRDHRYFSCLARAVEAAVDDRMATVFSFDGQPARLDLSGLLRARDSRPLIVFLERERHRAHLAVAYVQAQPFDAGARTDLLLALDIEIRFFSRLLEQVNLASPPLAPSWPEEERVPLLFVSLPKSLVAGRASNRSENRAA